MKISKLFHTLYAFLMFLPVMVLPLFAININQKEVEPLTAQIVETKLVDFNQLMPNDYHFDTPMEVEPYQNGFSVYAPLDSTNTKVVYYFDWLEGHNYLLRFNCFTDSNSNTYNLTFLYNTGTSQYYSDSIDNNIVLLTYLFNSDKSAVGQIQFYRDMSGSKVYYYNINIFDLTQMFGVGNEPTTTQFNEWYPNDYYQYTLSDKQILYTGVIDTLNNTDVGSQFLYSLYNPLKDYFNLPNYMNLGGLYDWFLVNLFSGYNSPVYFIIFDLMIYWLAMSILWLIFDVLMYVPSMIHKMLDKARME